MEPLVSVRCICYNHAKYLRQALDSVLCQRTNFPYEILVHDDASTDGSQEIIREYMNKYPDCIHAILQTENQFSQGRFPGSILGEMVRGEYSITLECDDFWQDEYKLQKQVDALRTHPECVMCVHRTEAYNESGIPTGLFIPMEQLQEGVLPQDKIVEYIANTAQFHTSSRLIRTKAYEALSQAPYYTKRKKVGDLPAILCLSQQGPFYYLPDTMTGYRMNSEGSYSKRLLEDYTFYCEERTEMREMWLLFGRCHPQYQEIALQQAEYCGTKEVLARLSLGSAEEYRLVHNEPYYQYYKKLPLCEKIKGWMRVHIPQSVEIWRVFKSLVKHEQ